MLEVILLFVLCLLITLGLFEFAYWLWMYSIVGNTARRGARYAIAHGADSASPANIGKIREVAREAFTARVPDSIPEDLAVHASWKPDNEPFSKVQVRAEYKFQSLTSRLIFAEMKIRLGVTSPAMVIVPQSSVASKPARRAARERGVFTGGATTSRIR